MHGDRFRLAAVQVVQRLSMLLFDIGGLEVPSFDLSRAPDLQSAGAIGGDCAGVCRRGR